MIKGLSLNTTEDIIEEKKIIESKNDLNNLNFKAQEKILNQKNIPPTEFIIKKIEKDGNCFYRTLSYFFRDTEEDLKEFRDLFATYFLNNLDEYIFAVADEDIELEENDNED